MLLHFTQDEVKVVQSAKQIQVENKMHSPENEALHIVQLRTIHNCDFDFEDLL